MAGAVSLIYRQLSGMGSVLEWTINLRNNPYGVEAASRRNFSPLAVCPALMMIMTEHVNGKSKSA